MPMTCNLNCTKRQCYIDLLMTKLSNSSDAQKYDVNKKRYTIDILYIVLFIIFNLPYYVC